MPANAGRSSPILPGAWASVWTLDPTYESDNDGQTPTNAASRMTDHKIQNDSISSPYPSVSRTTSARKSKRASRPSSSYSNGQASRSSSFDNDSDDFYSIISQEDITLFPVILTESSEVVELIAVKDIIPLSLLEPRRRSLEFSSRLHTVSSQEDLILSEAFSSKVVPVHSTHSSAATPDPTKSRNGVFLSVASGSRLSSSSAPETDTSTSSNRNSLSGDSESCSGRSMVFRKNSFDQESTHSNYSGLDYASVCNLIAQLANGIASEESLPATRRPGFARHQNSRPMQRRRNQEPEDDDRQTNELELSQPDGNAPWTLSLDPILTATESTTSHSSTASITSRSSHGSQDEISPRYPPFISSRPNALSPNNSSKGSRENAHHDTQTSTARQGPSNSLYALPVPSNNSNLPPALPSRLPEEASRPKNVMQKTKDLCIKFKRFLVQKTVSKQKDNAATLVAEVSAPSESTYADPPPSIQNTSPPASPRTWSFVRRGGFQRSIKSSMTSSQYSPYRQGTVTQTSMTSIDKRSYEYHARPKTLEEIRSKRRFSLPAFPGSRPTPPSKSAGQTGQTSTSNSHYPRRPRNGSIMTSASRNNSFLMNTLT